MGQVDRLGWTVGFTREYRGLRLGFRADRDDTLQLMSELLEPWQAEPCPAAEVEFLYSYRGGGQRGRFRDYHLLYHGARKVVRTLDAEELKAAFQSEVSLTIGLAAPDTVCFRGRAILWQGRALLFLGEDDSLRNRWEEVGASLAADSIFVLDVQSGRLLTHGQPEVGAVFATSAVARKRDRPRRLPAGEAALCLFEASAAADLQAQRLLPVLARFARTVPVFSGQLGRAGIERAVMHELAAMDLR